MNPFTKNMAVICVLCGLAAGAFLGCGGSQKQAIPNFDDHPWEIHVESPLDTLDLVEGEGVVELMEPDFPEGPDEEMTPQETPRVTETTPPAVPDAEIFTPGWRVQIFASSSMVSADELATTARGSFTEPVYVEYEPPLYKVRVGDFLTKDEARHMMNRAKAEDFDAWVVEALVVRPSQ